MVGAGAIMAVTGCSSSKSAGKQAAPSEPQKVEAKVEKPSAAAANVAAPVENIAGTPVTQAASSASPASQLSGKLEGEWLIVQAGKYKISSDGEMPYVNFSELDGKFYANNGCNVLNGNFLFKGADQVEFSNVISTQMYCPDIKYDAAVNTVLSDGKLVGARVETKGNETYLYLAGENGAAMTLRKHNLEALNGLWKFVKLDGKKVEVDGVNIFFDISELTVHGNTGCNYFNGGITVDPQIANSVSFSEMAVTMRLCENADVERQMLVALEEASTYSVSGKTLTLYGDNGQEVATLTR